MTRRTVRQARTGTAIVVALIGIAAIRSGAATGPQAVGQASRLYACIQADGQLERGSAGRPLIRQYGMRCAASSQQVSWHVDPEGNAPPSTAKPRPTIVATTRPTVPPTTQPATTTTVGSSGNEIRHPGTYTTAYDFQDNNPANSAIISHPVIHQTAGGTGTYSDPLTVAVDHFSNGTLQFAAGTKFYVPNVRAYLIAEDTTGETAPGTIHLDMWAGGETSSQSSAYDCMSHVTGNYLVIENPASNYAVVPGPLAANNTCRQLFGDTPVKV